MQGLEAHGRISPTGFYGGETLVPGPATSGKRGAVELLRVSQSLGDADHPPVVVQVALHGASALR